AGFRRDADSELSKIVEGIKIDPSKETDVKKIEKAIVSLEEFRDSSRHADQAKKAFEESSTAKNLLESLQKRKKELSGGITPPGEENKKPPTGEENKKPPTGEENKKPPTGEENKKTVESVKAEMKKTFSDEGKVRSALKELVKRDEYKELL